MEKTDELNKIAKQMSKLEDTAKVNEAINKSTKDEEKFVIDASNKRMAEINSKKETEATKSAEKVGAIKADTKASFADA
jgi:acetolactate synthase small subunit